MTERARMLTILKLASFYRKWGIIMGKYFGTDGVRGVAAVSYTHLDVYKRQRLYYNGCCDLLIKHIKAKGRIPPSW